MRHIKTYMEKNKREIEQIEQSLQIVTISARDIINKEHGEQEWIVPNFIPMPGVTVMAGQPASMKTWLCLELCLRAVQGGSFLGHFNIEGGHKVLFLDRENHEREIKKRLVALGAAPEQLNETFRFVLQDDFSLEDESATSRLIKLVKREGYDVLVFDSLRRFHGGDENDSRSISAVMRAFKRIADTGAAVIFTHHNRKEVIGRLNPDSMRGSSDIRAGVDAQIQIERRRDEGTLTFNQLKLRQSPEHPSFGVRIVSNETIGSVKFEHIGTGQADEGVGLEEEVIQVLRTSQAPLALKDIVQQLPRGASEARIRSLLNSLEGKRLEVTRGAHNTFLYAPLDVPLQE